MYDTSYVSDVKYTKLTWSWFAETYGAYILLWRLGCDSHPKFKNCRDNT